MSLLSPPDRKDGNPNLKINYTEPNIIEIVSKHLYTVIKQRLHNQDLIIVCIGTDRSTGDALGPLVGTNLVKFSPTNIHIYGTLTDPVHALNLKDTLHQITERHDDPFIVAIDACLGQVSSVGHIQIGEGPIKPGAGVKKELPPVGDIHITGVVNVGGFMEYFVLQNTRLSLVIKMSEIIANSLYIALMNLRQTCSTPFLPLDESLLFLPRLTDTWNSPD